MPSEYVPEVQNWNRLLRIPGGTLISRGNIRHFHSIAIHMLIRLFRLGRNLITNYFEAEKNEKSLVYCGLGGKPY